MNSKTLAAEIHASLKSALEAWGAKGNNFNIAEFLEACANNLGAGLGDRTVDDRGCTSDEELADAFEVAARELRRDARARDDIRAMELRHAKLSLDDMAERGLALAQEAINEARPNLRRIRSEMHLLLARVLEAKTTGEQEQNSKAEMVRALNGTLGELDQRVLAQAKRPS
jgi:hypothetical protein